MLMEGIVSSRGLFLALTFASSATFSARLLLKVSSIIAAGAM